MSISEVGNAAHGLGNVTQRKQGGDRDSFDRFKVGQQLELHIQQQLAADRYLVRFAGAQHIVQAAMSMTAGATLSATVVAIGHKLELRCLPPGTKASAQFADQIERDIEGPLAELLDETADAFAVVLNNTDYSVIAEAMGAASQPLDMALSGLFLSKLNQRMESESLSAVYSALTWTIDRAALTNSAATQLHSSIESSDLQSLGQFLEQELSTSLDPGTNPGALANESIEIFAGQSNGERGERNLAQELLNTQDEGGVAYAYGSLPILIADQLVELDVVLFRDRQGQGAPNAMRRLVMTLQTENLGRVEIMAQALGSRLTIAIKTENEGASTALASQSDGIRDLVAELGWHIESIDYDVDPLRTRAAREIVNHVLKSGSVDRMV